MAKITVRFKLIGANAGKNIQLGPKKQYHFVKGICEFECKTEDAQRHAQHLGRFYSAKRVKPSKEATIVEEVLPDVDDDEEEEKPTKKASKKKTE